MSAHDEPDTTAAELNTNARTRIQSLLLESRILQGRIEGLRACMQDRSQDEDEDGDDEEGEEARAIGPGTRWLSLRRDGADADVSARVIGPGTRWPSLRRHHDGAEGERSIVIGEEMERMREEVGSMRREVDGFRRDVGEAKGLGKLEERVRELEGAIEM